LAKFVVKNQFAFLIEFIKEKSAKRLRDFGLSISVFVDRLLFVWLCPRNAPVTVTRPSFDLPSGVA
jgi:hypothetical protein